MKYKNSITQSSFAEFELDTKCSRLVGAYQSMLILATKKIPTKQLANLFVHVVAIKLHLLFALAGKYIAWAKKK